MDEKSELKEAAQAYFERGAPIVVVKQKRPLVEWQRWQTQPQTPEEFENQPWHVADGFAIICGTKQKNGLYIAAVDFDVKNVSDEAKAKGKEILKTLPITQIEETPSGGKHLIYQTHAKPRTISAYHNECALELIGEGKLCIMAPSAGYKRLNDNTPTTVHDLEEELYRAMHQAGFKPKPETPKTNAWFDRNDLRGNRYTGKTPPCIEALYNGAREGERNEYAIRLASFLINFRKLRADTALEQMRKINKLNEPPLDDKELQGIVKSAVNGGYIYGCSDDILSKNCDKTNCPLQPGKKQLVFDEKIKAKAMQLLRDPAFFYKLGKIFEVGFYVPKINKPRFVIEEERNKRLLGLLLLGASKLQMTSIVKVLGEPGTAKDTMLRMWLRLLEGCLKTAERSYFTAASLRYSEELQDCDLLYIPDSPDLTGERGRHLRFMRSDDGGMISEYALKDPETGEMTTKTVVLPFKAVATTSNVVTGDVALESGMWTLHTNASPELTKMVKFEKLRFRAGKKQLLPDDELKVWQCAFKLLVEEEPMQELPKIPFAERLADLLVSERSESRRDPDKFCDLIALVAWARRFQKQKEKWAEADWADLYVALQLGLDAITETISDLDLKEQQIFNCVKDGMPLLKDGKETKTKDVTTRYIADQTGIPYKTCFRLLEKMVEKGFINKDKRKGKNVYSVFREKEPKEFLIGLDINENSPEKLLKHVLSFAGDFSPSHQGEKGYSLIDPLTGDKLTVEFNNSGDPTVQVESCNIVYPSVGIVDSNSISPLFKGSEKVRSVEISMKKALNGENKLEKQISQQMRSDLGLYLPESISQAYKNEKKCGTPEVISCKGQSGQESKLILGNERDSLVFSERTSEKESVKQSNLMEKSEGSEGYSRRGVELGAKRQIIVKRTKNAEPCFYCEHLASEYKFTDLDVEYHVCPSCLKEVVIPAYQRQDYEITIESEA